MITYDGQKIKKYWFIDHCAEGVGAIEPKEGEEIIGRSEYLGDHDEVFIEHRKNGKTTQTTNIRDVSCIQFYEEEL